MCFHSKQSKKAQELEKRFNAKFENSSLYKPSEYNGFTFPKTPVITNIEKEKIQLFWWGLIPHWAKDNSIRKNTLNARIETIHEKPSYRGYIKNRCLILIDGFYEWKWLDSQGKKKQKYLITLPNGGAFALAGLYSEWNDKSKNEVYKTYTILTTQADEFMGEIHNSRNRMPVIVPEESESLWLNGEAFEPQSVKLKAEEVNY